MISCCNKFLGLDSTQGVLPQSRINFGSSLLMKLFVRFLSLLFPLWTFSAGAVSFQFDQEAVLYSTTYKRGINFRSSRGVPISATADTKTTGSDGRQPAQPAGTPNQFRGMMVFGGMAVPAISGRSSLNGNLSFVRNAEPLNLPRSTASGRTLVLRSVQTGATYLSRQVSFSFGSLITPPLVGTDGLPLTNVSPKDYWVAEPYSTTAHAGAAYYWSPHARSVFAIQPGMMQIKWRKAQPSTTKPADFDSNPTRYALLSGLYYTIYSVDYIVTGSADKTPRKIYWTESSFRSTGKPVQVPAARVSAVKVAYNTAFPERVTTEFLAPGQSEMVTTNRLYELRTLWFDHDQGQILAYNLEGRVFIELLGESLGGGIRKHLGYEIVDVIQQAIPRDTTAELGEVLTPTTDPNEGSALTPEPVVVGGVQPFTFQHNIVGTDQMEYFATRESINQNDVLVHWLETGGQGLRWPLLYSRYKLVWPTDVAKYSHYVRPDVETESEAKLTAVHLPNENIPTIQYQDPLDQPRAHLTETFSFYTFLNQQNPVHRSLLRFSSGDDVTFERVFSWLDVTLKQPASFVGTLATNLTGWDSTNRNFSWNEANSPLTPIAPRIVSATVNVGDRLLAPLNELGASGSYLAGYILQSAGNSFHPGAYIDPFVSGFEEANQGAIIPVNAIPGRNKLDVWWYRQNVTNSVKNPSNGFKPIYWPAVIGRYTLAWPSGRSEIVLASNDGSGALSSLEAKGSIYVQNDPTQVGYNPNEEHALMSGGRAYALRDDLNLVVGINYSSAPYVLLNYTGADGRPSIKTFNVLREKPSAGLVFDYVVTAGGNVDRSGAGRVLQAPMPLPLLEAPTEFVSEVTPTGTNYTLVNYNAEPSAAAGDLPIGWNTATANAYPNYSKFTYRDRKQNFWVLRGLHAGLPSLNAGTYNSSTKTFSTSLPTATAVRNQPFHYTIHLSRQADTLIINTADGSALPTGLRFGSTNGLVITGTPTTAGSHNLNLVITDTGDGSKVTNTLVLNVVASGSVVAQAPLTVKSANQYALNDATYVGRPPFLAEPAVPTNSFTMRFYYKTLEGFAWPGWGTAPAKGSIVPYLRPVNGAGEFVGAADQKTAASLQIVYRPVWPGKPPEMQFGQTLTSPKNGLPAVRGQTSVELLYQQAIAKTITSPKPAVTLHDPTREKTFALKTNTNDGLTKIPDGVRTEDYQGKTYFPNLPPHLAKRVFFDPVRGVKGELVLRGEFVDEVLGDDYLLLNVLRGDQTSDDLAVVKALCPSSDNDKGLWDTAVGRLSSRIETFHENPQVPGKFIVNTALTVTKGVEDLAEVTSRDMAVDSYALSASGPGQGYVTMIVGDGGAFTPPAEPVTVYVLKVGNGLYPGEMKIVPAANPLSELTSFQHSPDLAGKYGEYEYQWKIAPPVDGMPPVTNSTMSNYQGLTSGTGIPRYTLGGAGIQALVDNYIVMRYRPLNKAHPLYEASTAADATNWSAWTTPQLVEGWIKRVLAGINPFNQRVTDLNNNGVNTDANMMTSAGKRWEGDIPLSLENIDNYGLIEIYETVLRRGRGLSIDSEPGINYGPANDALLLAAGYLNDLYMMVGNEAYADSANPTIGIGTKDPTYGDIATALFSFKGQLPTLLEEELALLRGRDNSLQPGVTTSPVYNRLVWNYTRGINSGEVIYALNYNIVDQNEDGTVDASDSAVLYPQGHGDAYGHYLTAVKGYYSLLMNAKFDWVPRTESVTVLGKPVQVDYMDERKFAAAASAVARTGRQVFDLTWRKDYQPGASSSWEHFGATRVSADRTREWGLDQWAARTGQGSLFNWVVGNAILPEMDLDPTHEGIQKIDRFTVPELGELATAGSDLQTAMDNAEGRLTPLGLAEGSIAFDINPNQVLGNDPQTHFDQVYSRAKATLNNAVSSFDDAKDVTRLMRTEQDSLTELQVAVARQEMAFTNALIALYGSPYPEDIGPGRTYKQGYEGPDLIHYVYVTNPELSFNDHLTPGAAATFKIDTQDVSMDWWSANQDAFNAVVRADSPAYQAGNHYFEYNLDSHGYLAKPENWVSQRRSPGKIQQAISDYIKAHTLLAQELGDAEGAKGDFDDALKLFQLQNNLHKDVAALEKVKFILNTTLRSAQFADEVFQQVQDLLAETVEEQSENVAAALPESFIAGLAAGGDVTSAARSAIEAAGAIAKGSLDVLALARFAAVRSLQFGTETTEATIDFKNIPELERAQELKEALLELGGTFGEVQGHFVAINQRLRELDDKRRAYLSLVAEGERLQLERQVYRQRSAALVQGFRTRDAAFRIFRNEKLERYKTLFDLAARYAYLAANAYDYETGLLKTDQGKSFINRIVNSRALGVVKLGEPQYAGSNAGDPGLSSALAEMKADWDVLKGRLGFNNPDAYGTTVSLRGENSRILPGSEGDSTWQDLLSTSRLDNLLDDADVRRNCLQIDRGNGLPVPGIVLTFSTTIAPGQNLFGRSLAAGDHNFSSALFATKIFSVGVALEGYLGMDNPPANLGAVGNAGGNSPSDPTTFADPNAMAATPSVYLIPVGVDSMRSPPLGDTSTIRSWSVDDLAIPLPFNISASDFSTEKLYQSSDSLTEPLFALRKHQPFRPVPTALAFSPHIYGGGGSLQLSQFTNRRLIGRSVWNSQWKIVIPGETLLNDPKQGLERFVRTVKDVKLHFVTYSYSGN